MMKKLFMQGVAAIAIVAPVSAFAQSTGSVDFENSIVVTGRRADGVSGVVIPETSKAKAVLTQEMIAKQRPGNTILDTINILPGVSFQNNDPYGSAGGVLNIRGFDSSRISLTVDGIPLNDTGNYAIYSSQQVDPELIDQVNVNLGSTDVDSPTAAASGSTVNYRTLVPSDDFHAMLSGSAGEYSYFRLFGMVQTGAIGPWGTKAWFSASHAENNNVFNHFGVVDKQQYNGKIYQPIGSNGDFISIAGHYSESRNNFFGSVPLRTDTAGGRVVGPNSTNRFPLTKKERFYTIARCEVDTPQAGVADAANTCGSTFDERINPSNTGNIRINSRFTLADGLVLTVDPSYQYVKANGGGTAVGREGLGDIAPGSAVSLVPGYIGGTPYAGHDLNGDGDALDQVRLLTPSQTQTNRYGVIASLRYDLDDANTVRVAYSYDRGRHRQTGEVGPLNVNGTPVNPFPVDIAIPDSSGSNLQKRDRLSYAILQQVSGEYNGKFFADALRVNLGIRAPFFKRDLNNFCFTTSATGNTDCFGTDDAATAQYAALNPTIQGPQQRVLKYNKVLPNGGLTFNLTPAASLFANYSKGLQVPGTDNLYNSFFFAPNTDAAHPKPETTDNFDFGVRYNTGRLQAQLSGWYTKYTNRLASSYDPETDRTVYRNLGKVDKYGVDGSIAYNPIDEVTFYAFGSYLKSKIKDNLQLAGVNYDCSNASESVPLDVTNCAFTKGKREGNAPTYTFGGRIEGHLGPVELGAQAKRTGPRYANDQNTPVYQTISGVKTEVYGAKVPAYWLVDLDARISLEPLGLNDKTFLQLNVTNLFDVLYVGGISSAAGSSNTTVPNAQIGAPRAISGTIVFAL